MGPCATGDNLTMRLLLLRGFYWGTVAGLLLPFVLVVAMSFKDGSIVSFPLGKLSGRWYWALLDDADAQHAVVISVGIAVCSTGLALALGIWSALAFAVVPSRAWRLVLLGGAMVPLVTPGIIHAIALRIFIREVGLDPGLFAVIFGHAVHAMPYVVIMVAARLTSMPPSLMEAARNLGASPFQCFRHIVLPWLSPAVLGATMLALLTSFDDFVRSFFLGAYQATLPVLIYGRLHSGFTPELNAISTLVLVVAGLAGIVGAAGPWRWR